MPTECNWDSLDFGTVKRRQVVGACDGGTITLDAGALLLSQTDRAIRLVSQVQAAHAQLDLDHPTTDRHRACQPLAALSLLPAGTS